MSKQHNSPGSRLGWRGLGCWNFYFLLKFILLWQGYLNFDALNNLFFAACLLFPLRSQKIHRWRQWVALPFGLALFYHDSWLPGLHSIINQGKDVTGFSASYLFDLANRFINWQWLGIVLVLWVAFLFLSQWLRITTFIIAGLLWVNIQSMVASVHIADTTAQTAPARTPTASNTTPPEVNGPPTEANLNAYLQQFYRQQQKSHTEFPQTLPADAQPFDVLVINICSLAWSDLDAVKLADSPFWSRFDLLFNNFNSATAYSGPASIRLLRASCGQTSHHDLYQPADQRCYLFDNLAKLGFSSEFAMDHSGSFGNYLSEIRAQGDMQAPLMSQNGIDHELVAFNAEPIFNDGQLFSRWLQQQDPQRPRTASFFNLLALHDGNRFIGATHASDYRPRAEMLISQLDSFIDQLNKSGRRVMLIVIPEHGAALIGDKMQISGLRDIPSPGITHIPVGIKFIGMKAAHSTTLRIDTPSSFLAVSELVSRAVDGKMFTANSIDWQAYTSSLPTTPLVSENENAVVMEYQGKPYIRLNGGSWVPYPQ
jgi:cellulose synthase operon protein YhjU